MCKADSLLQIRKDKVFLQNCNSTVQFNLDEELDDEDKYENYANLEAQKIFDTKWPKLFKHLFNVAVDPEERIDLKRNKPQILKKLRKRAREHFSTIVKDDYPEFSEKGKPEHFNNIWSPGWC